MKHDKEATLRHAQLAFIGRVLSAFTHELKNHLAIINESSGLMGDLIELGRLKDEETSEKFQKIISTIAERIDLANTLIKNLNSFGHRMDKPATEYSVNDVLQEEMILMNKFAKLKAIVIDMDMQEDIPTVRGNPALLQYLVYIILAAFFVNAQKGDIFKVATRKQDDNVTILLETQNTDFDISPEYGLNETELISYVSGKLEIDLREEQRTAGRAHLLTLPRA